VLLSLLKEIHSIKSDDGAENFFGTPATAGPEGGSASSLRTPA